MEEPSGDEVKIRARLINSAVERELQFFRDGNAVINATVGTVDRQADFTMPVLPNTTSVKIKAEVVGDSKISRETTVPIPPEARPAKEKHKLSAKAWFPGPDGRILVTVNIDKAAQPMNVAVQGDQDFRAEILTPTQERNINGPYFEKQSSPRGELVFKVEIAVFKMRLTITIPGTTEKSEISLVKPW